MTFLNYLTIVARIPTFFEGLKIKINDSRFKSLIDLSALFIFLSTVTRIGLYAFSDEWQVLPLFSVLSVFGVGLIYDLAVLAYLIAVLGVLYCIFPNSRIGRSAHGVFLVVLIPVLIFGLLFVAASEFLFWNEFASRFNFIAVDYLVYTREVIGNIRESYALGPILMGLGMMTVIIAAIFMRRFWGLFSAEGFAARVRLKLLAVLVCAPVASFALVDDSPKLWLESRAARELAGNGYYEFMRAFRNNDLDFKTFYATIGDDEARDSILGEFKEADTNSVLPRTAEVMGRRYAPRAASPKPLNLILVTMESLGAEYVSVLGGKPGITPHLNRLSREGLFFTSTYATGLRTVRGLEAVTLSLPPLPGHAIPVRKDNKNFQTLGSVLRENGYQTTFFYGGYSQFDNMKDFFGGNGYQVVDRTDIPSDKISHETIWGVADEDLFQHTLSVLSEQAKSGRPFFAHVMTTSNHRPFTFPSGRVPLASGSGREGAVQYADWSVGDFLTKAQKLPWFDDTVFVFVADHTSLGRGRIDLEPKNFHIPFLIYSPKHIRPRQVDVLNSQIDVAPTVLGILGLTYDSYFMGQDILTEGVKHQRAFLANYLTVGYLEEGRLVSLMPNRRRTVVDLATMQELPLSAPEVSELLKEAIAHYQFSSRWIERRPR